jgi:hypothetical protein
MSSLPELPNLHDAVFESLEVIWEIGSVRVNVTRVPGGPAELACRRVRKLMMTRRLDWGPSVFVNKATVEADEDGNVVLRLAMQSGDDITVVAEEVVVDADGISGVCRAGLCG